MTLFILIFLGSGLGGVLRYALSGWFQNSASHAFPVGTLAVNVLGCLAIGYLSTSAGPVMLLKEEHRIALMVGLLGGFTTFSAFGRETFALAADRNLALALLNIILSITLCLAAVWLGSRMAAGR